MRSFRSHAAALAVLALLAGWPPLSMAADPATDETAGMVQSLHEDLARPFSLPAELKLDPELRAEAESIAAAHLERLRQQLPAWIQEERRLQTAADGKPNSSAVFFAVFARVLNELALWQIEPGDAAYEQATLAAIASSPLVCRTKADDRFPDFASRIARAQHMPPAQRQHVLATERRLLEAWGKPRKAALAWPNPLPQDAVMAAIGQARAGAKPTPLPLPPILASELLAANQSYQDLTWDVRCAVQQWWLRVGLAQKAAPAAVLNAFRYGTLITASDRLGNAFDSAGAPAAPAPDPAARPAYPKLAQRFVVTGVTTVTRSFDAAGKPAQASIADRRITVQGIRDVRPLAFETIFDAPSLRFALSSAAPGKAGGAPAETFQMNWDLEPPDDAPAGATAKPAAKKQGAKQ